MKKIFLIITFLLTLTIKAQVPCPNDNNFWLDLTPTGVGNTQSSACTYAGDYDTFTAINGATYSITVCGGSYNSAVTMYSSAGVLLYSQNATAGNGCETFTWTATSNMVVWVLVDRSNCGTNTTCTSVQITQTTAGSGGGGSGNQNCSSYTQVCNDASFAGNSSGAGTQELNAGNQGCMSTEHQSSWYVFNVVSSGTLALNITTAVDYDFAIWGPNVTCGALGTPIRCSWAAGGGNTGLGNGAVDVTEGAGGDRWVQTLPVTAGQTYIMLIDNFTANSTAFTLDWTMTGGASLNCTPLPIELVSFTGYNISDNYNLLEWVTVSELNNDYFTLEKSGDGIYWNVISKIDGSGNSNTPVRYEFKDYEFSNKINYYRLKQTDFNSEYKYYQIVSIDNTSSIKTPKLIGTYNQLGQTVDSDYRGFIIERYSDGSSRKLIRE